MSTCAMTWRTSPSWAGDVSPSAEANAHVAGCARCRSAMALAVDLEHALAQDVPVEIPDRFTQRVIAKIDAEPRRRQPRVMTGDLFGSIVSSGALVGAAVLVFSSTAGAPLTQASLPTTLTAALLFALGLVLMWTDDPASRDVPLSLRPW